MGADLHLNVNMPEVYSFRSVNYAFRASYAERDANMKRQLVEDLKTRMKFLQEMEKSYRGQVEDLEKKVHPAQGERIRCSVLKTVLVNERIPFVEQFLLCLKEYSDYVVHYCFLFCVG